MNTVFFHRISSRVSIRISIKMNARISNRIKLIIKFPQFKSKIYQDVYFNSRM